MRCRNPFRLCLSSSCSQANKRRSTSLGFNLYGNFLASESFPWLWGVLKWLVESLPMIVPILLDFDTSLAQVMPPILHLLSSTAMLVFDIKITVLEALKPRHVLSLIAASPHKYLRAFDEPQPQISSYWSKKLKPPANDENLACKLTFSIENNFMVQTQID